MDGLRLALIVVGVAVVALVYFLTARRRRIDREAGQFDRFGAWTDSTRDPLVDETGPHEEPAVPGRKVIIDDALLDESGLTYEAPPAGPPEGGEEAAAGGSTDATPPRGPAARPSSATPSRPGTRESAPPPAASRPSPRSGAGSEPSGDVLQGLDSIAETVDEDEPALGELSAVQEPAVPRPPPARVRKGTGSEAPKPQPGTRGRGKGAPPGEVRRGAPRKQRRKALQAELELEPVSPTPAEPELVVALNILAPQGERFEGATVHDALNRAGLRFGDLQAYHYREPASGSRSREPASGSRSREPASGSRSREPASGSRSREPASGSRSREPASGSRSREPASGSRSREPASGSRSREPASGSRPREPASGSNSGTLFSVLNAVNPGTLDPADSDGLLTPGLVLVMRLPGPEQPMQAFETMNAVAERLAAELGGRVCDASRSSLTRQAANHLREQIAEYGRRKRLGA